MNTRRLLVYCFASLSLILAASISPACVSAADSAPALQCGHALERWKTTTAGGLSFSVLSVRPSSTPATTTPTTSAVDLVEVAVENDRDQPLVLTPNLFRLIDCVNDELPALSCASGPNVQPLSFTPPMDERATDIAQANATACKTLPMLIGQNVPSHGRSQGWVAFPTRPGAQPRALEFFIFDVGTHPQGWIRCPLVRTDTTPTTSAPSIPAACVVYSAIPVSATPPIS